MKSYAYLGLWASLYNDGRRNIQDLRTFFFFDDLRETSPFSSVPFLVIDFLRYFGDTTNDLSQS